MSRYWYTRLARDYKACGDTIYGTIMNPLNLFGGNGDFSASIVLVPLLVAVLAIIVIMLAA